MTDIQVLVQVYYLGRTRKEIVEVPEEAFVKDCWRTIAALKAAVMMEIPFSDVDRLAKYGLRPEEKKRFFGETSCVEEQNERSLTNDEGPQRSAAPTEGMT